MQGNFVCFVGMQLNYEKWDNLSSLEPLVNEIVSSFISKFYS